MHWNSYGKYLLTGVVLGSFLLYAPSVTEAKRAHKAPQNSAAITTTVMRTVRSFLCFIVPSSPCIQFAYAKTYYTRARQKGKEKHSKPHPDKKGADHTARVVCSLGPS